MTICKLILHTIGSHQLHDEKETIATTKDLEPIINRLYELEKQLSAVIKGLKERINELEIVNADALNERNNSL